MTSLHLWLRHETRPSERRAPLVPHDAARLVADGVRVDRRGVAAAGLRRSRPTGPAGARSSDAGSWPEAPDDAHVLGVKELPDEPDALRHSHIFFGHAYKGQDGADDLLAPVRRGRGRAARPRVPHRRGAPGHRVRLLGRVRRGLARGARRARDASGRCARWSGPSSTPSSRRPGAPASAPSSSGRRGAAAAARSTRSVAAGADLTAWDREDTLVLDRERAAGPRAARQLRPVDHAAPAVRRRRTTSRRTAPCGSSPTSRATSPPSTTSSRSTPPSRRGSSRRAGWPTSRRSTSSPSTTCPRCCPARRARPSPPTSCPSCRSSRGGAGPWREALRAFEAAAGPARRLTARDAASASADEDAGPIGMRPRAQIMSIAALLSRAQPCDAGYGGMFGDPCTAQPR